MRIHLIAVGGSVMHNLALELKALGHNVTGSDDEIYEPAKSRLAVADLLPADFGWDANRIDESIDLIVLGMHAQVDNPELIRAQELSILIQSFPEFVASHIKDKRKIVVCGSHGKTTTTSMIMHALRKQGLDFDYLVGGLVAGFDRMVRLSDTSTVAVVEGDEYLSSRIDNRPKMLLYDGDVIIITGVAWDHMNVFPTHEIYLSQFKKLINQIDDGGILIFYDEPDLRKLSSDRKGSKTSYNSLESTDSSVVWENALYPISVFGDHNLANMNAARLACENIGVSAPDFLSFMADFKGAGKRLEKIHDLPIVYRDFAHAPSKVKATAAAVLEKHREESILVIVELHTYSSLNREFLPQYEGALDGLENCILFYDPHALAIKRLPSIDRQEVIDAFGNPNLVVVNSVPDFHNAIEQKISGHDVVLIMSSGNLGGLNVLDFI